MLTVPPFPYTHGYDELSKGAPILFRSDMNDEDMQGLHLAEVAMVDAQLVTSGMLGYVGVATGIGSTVEAASANAYRLARKVIVPNCDTATISVNACARVASSVWLRLAISVKRILQFSNQKRGVHRQRVLSVIEEKRQREIVEHYLDGATSIEMTLMYWLKATWDVAIVENGIQTSINALREFSDIAARQDTEALAALAVMLDRNRSGCDRIVRMFHSRVDSDDPADSVADGIAFCKRLFDWSVQQSAEASVALFFRRSGDTGYCDPGNRRTHARLGSDRCR